VTCILGEETDRYVNKIAPKPVFFLARSRNGWIDANQILHICFLGGRRHLKRYPNCFSILEGWE